MLNADLTPPRSSRPGEAARPTDTQRVVIVNGSSEMLQLLEPVLDGGQYDIVFVESTDHAYSYIRRIMPDLVILCLRMDDVEGFRVLSMLKLDEATREIPVLTYTAGDEDDEQDEDEASEPAAADLFTPRRLERMN